MPRPETLIPLSLARRELELLKAELRGERRATLRLIKSLGWDESKHHRDHGKFSSGGGGADTEATVSSAPATPATLSSPPPGVDHISAAVADAVAGLDPHQASHVTLLAVKAATKAHAALTRLTPAMFRALDTLGLVFDTPDDLRKFGWSPSTSGTATGDAMAAGDPVRAATGVPSHIAAAVAAAVAAKVLGAGLAWARQQLGMSPMVKKAEEAPDFAGLAAVLAEAFGAVAEGLGIDSPDPAAIAAALGAIPLAKAVPADDADEYGPLYEAALEAVIHARESGDDDAVAGIVEAYREHLDTGGAIHKAGKWDTNKHPRDDHGRFVSRDAIADAKGNPEKEEALREKVTDPEEREKLDNALAGTTDLGRTKAGQRKHEAGQRRAKKAADHARAGEIADKIGAGTATHEEMHELGDHLEGLTVDKLRALQSRIPTAGRTPRKADMVAALRESLERSAHAKRVEAGAAGVEQRPAADHARLALAGMQPNRYDVTTAGGEVVPAGKGYQRWEGGGKAVGYTAAEAAKVAAGVTPDHADRRIEEHERAAGADGLDDVQREYHATIADQLRDHKEKVFGGAKTTGPTPADIEDASRQMRDMDRERQVREDDDAEYENRKANWDNWEDKRDRMNAWAADKPDSLAAQGAANAARARMAPPDRGGSVGTAPAAKPAATTAHPDDAELAALNRTPAKQLTREQKQRKDQLSRESFARKFPGATPIMTGGGKGPGVSDSENEGTAGTTRDTVAGAPATVSPPIVPTPAKVAAGVTADHADRRIAEHEAAASAAGLDDVQREYHATIADQLRGHKEKVFGGGQEGVAGVLGEVRGKEEPGEDTTGTGETRGVPRKTDALGVSGSSQSSASGSPGHTIRRIKRGEAYTLDSGESKKRLGSDVYAVVNGDGHVVTTGANQHTYDRRHGAESAMRGIQQRADEGQPHTQTLATYGAQESARQQAEKAGNARQVSALAGQETDPVRRGELHADATATAQGYDYINKPSVAARHRTAVEAALAAGKPVPPEVLADYPDLAPKAAAKPGKADPHLAPVLAAHAAAPAGSKLRDYLDAAIGNASPAGHDASNPPKSLTPEQGRRLRKELASAHADAHAAGNLTPEDDAAFGKVMQGLGVKPLHEVGATVPFDPATMESSSGVSTGTPVTVGRRGWSGLYGDAKTGHENIGNNVRRAVVAPAAATVGKPTPPEKPVPAAKPARKPKADTAATSGYGQSGADHPLAGLDRESQWKRLGHLSGDSGEADRERLIASGPPKGLNLDTFNRDVHAAIAHADDQGLNAATAEAVYDRAGKKHGLTKAGFVRAMAALHNDEDNPDRMGRPGASQGTDLLAAQGRDPELMMPDRGGAASQFRLPRGADAATLKAEGERLYGGEPPPPKAPS